MTLPSREIDEQVAYSVEEARKHLAHGHRRKAADELQFAAERAVDPRHVSVIRQLATSSRESSRRFGRGRWDKILATLEQRSPSNDATGGDWSIQRQTTPPA
jgi:hypothetical protein